MKKELLALIKNAERTAAELPNQDVIDDYPTLVQAILQKELNDEIVKLKALLALKRKESIKEQFEKICIDREEKNKNTKLHFITMPESLCNTLYLNFAKELYQTNSFGTLCSILLPSIKNIYVATTELEAQPQLYNEAPPPKRRLTQVVKIHTINHDDETLKTMLLKPESFKRLVISGDNLFLLDTIESFNFELHYQVYKILKEKNPELYLSIATHNTSLTELYQVLTRCYSEGATIKETLLPLIHIMSISGERLGHGLFATDEGTQAAKQLEEYYDNLPEDLKNRVGECTAFGSDTMSFNQVISAIKQYECIETCAAGLLAIMGNRANSPILQLMPSLSEEEKRQLIGTYKKYKKGESIVTLDSGSLITNLPSHYTTYFYPQLTVENFSTLISMLITFPTTEYLSIFRHVNLNALDLPNYLYLITSTLNSQQNEALATVLEDIRIKAQFADSNPAWFIAYIFTEAPEFIDSLFKNYTEAERLVILSETDATNKTAMHYIAEGIPNQKNTTAFKTLLQLYPDNNTIRLQALRDQPDSEGKIALHHLANNAELMELVMGLYLTHEKGREMLMTDLLSKTRNGCNVLHLAAHSKSIKVIMEFFIREKLCDCLNPLATTDMGDNNVLHYTLSNLETFSFLLNTYTNANSCITTLLKRDKWGRTVFQPRITKPYETLNLILLFFINKNAGELCIKFLQTPMGQDASSPLNTLATHEKGISIIMDLMHENTKSIIQKMPIEAWFPPIAMTEKHKNMLSPIYRLVQSVAGMQCLVSLIALNPAIEDYLTPKNCLLFGLDHVRLNHELESERRLRASLHAANTLRLFNSPSQDHDTLLERCEAVAPS